MLSNGGSGGGTYTVTAEVAITTITPLAAEADSVFTTVGAAA
jgi:hypothetical protein